MLQWGSKLMQTWNRRHKVIPGANDHIWATISLIGRAFLIYRIKKRKSSYLPSKKPLKKKCDSTLEEQNSTMKIFQESLQAINMAGAVSIRTPNLWASITGRMTTFTQINSAPERLTMWFCPNMVA